MFLKNLSIVLFSATSIALFTSCNDYDEGKEINTLLTPEAGEEFSGGNVTIFNETADAFGFQAPKLTSQQGLEFFVGNSFFSKSWVTAPASTVARDGLGPLFNARACASCHFKDGRGNPPFSTNNVGSGMLIRLSIGNDPIEGPIPDPNYGDQLQDQSILGVLTEATFKITYEPVQGTYPDGTKYELRKPTYHIENLTQGKMQAEFISPRVANQMIGLGLLEAISEEDILKNADVNDSNNDGISGKPNYVRDFIKGGTSLGRFGWKCNQPTIKQQAAAAFAGDMGLTTSIFPNENIPPSAKDRNIPNGGTPEVSDRIMNRVNLYSSTLAVPVRRGWKEQNVLRGKQLFNKLDCTKCHIPKFTTGDHPIAALANQKIRPYTDLLLHDMGEDLADNREDFLASGREWRTQPLWGIGLIKTVNRHQFLLHDGRARGVEEAVLWHGGEAENSKNKFMELSKKERDEVISFVNSL